VEARADDDAEKNRLCPALTFTGHSADVFDIVRVGMNGIVARTGDPDMNAWTESCRLNPARGAAEHLDDPRVPEGFSAMGTHFAAALENLERHAASTPAAV
jgi:hypothetical protein